MSEFALERRPLILPVLRPEAAIGAASPLWGYFTGAAVMGVAWWWAARWARTAGAAPSVGEDGARPLALVAAANESPPAPVVVETLPLAAVETVEQTAVAAPEAEVAPPNAAPSVAAAEAAPAP